MNTNDDAVERDAEVLAQAYHETHSRLLEAKISLATKNAARTIQEANLATAQVPVAVEVVPEAPPTVRTLSNDEVRKAFMHGADALAGGTYRTQPMLGADFDAWLRSVQADAPADHSAAAGLLATAKHSCCANVLRDAADAIGHAPGCQPDPDRDPYVGCECRISLIYARAARLPPGCGRE